MIIPIGHESNSVRRLPWVTFAVMAACLVIHIFVYVQVKKASREFEKTALEYIEYYIQHPYLELDPEIKEQMFGKDNVQIDQLLELYRSQASANRARQVEEQEELNQLAEKLQNSMEKIPYRKWGFIPAQMSFLGLLTYMFIHSGWLHLLGNLFFLYLTGPFIEDVWGRMIYSIFYLSAGFVAALMFAWHYPSFSGPLVGASGAIAGVMGAFLVRYWNTRIEFFYFFLIFVRGTFKAPAWLMLPLWFLLELFNARIMDSISPDGSGGGVAHWAHVWGFVFGAGCALLIKYFKIEEKFVNPRIESQIKFTDEGFLALENALKKRRLGDNEEAYSILKEGIQKKPGDSDLIECFWDLGVEMGNTLEPAKYLTLMIEREIRREQMDSAFEHFKKLRYELPAAAINLSCKIMLLQYLIEKRDLENIRELSREVLAEIDVNTSPGLLLKLAEQAVEFDQATAAMILELCLLHPEIPPEQKEDIKQKLQKHN